MTQQNITSVVIVGGGTAGWMTAAALSKILEGKVKLTLIESDEIATVGVGESTIPMIQLFNKVLGIDENEFIRATQGSFKLGIEFRDWGQLGERYMHGFGIFGQQLATLPFYQYWLRMQQSGKAAPIERYSINQMAALENRFMRADRSRGNSPLADIVHAFHIDAGRYAGYLRQYSEQRGVRRLQGKVVQTLLRPADGHVEAVRMDDGALVSGQLFIDCSGFHGLLIEQALHTGFEDWSHWLPCNRAWAVPCSTASSLLPYTRATARPAGWQWRIGLQHRTGNGHVYASDFMTDQQALDLLMQHLDGQPLADPRLLRFTAGRRKQTWNRNVVAIGLSSGFLEPLESTSIHLIQSSIARLISFFPDQGFSAPDVAEFNRQSDFEIERIRDFIILHYHATRRNDSAFWDYCRTMPIPATLSSKIELYRSRGRIVRTDNELFSEVAWLQVLLGQGITPQGHHPLADVLEDSEVADYLGDISDVIASCVAQMPDHAEFIAQHCAAPIRP